MISFDLSYRPQSYFAARDSSVSDAAARSARSRSRGGWARPGMMGGESLPEMKPREVEIARISLASVMGDAISIRAKQAGAFIRYAICDEHENSYRVSPQGSRKPLTFGELVSMLEAAQPLGLAIGFLEKNYLNGEGSELNTLRFFVRVSSDFYPELEAYYDAQVARWCEEQSAARAAVIESPDISGHGQPTAREMIELYASYGKRFGKPVPGYLTFNLEHSDVQRRDIIMGAIKSGVPLEGELSDIIRDEPETPAPAAPVEKKPLYAMKPLAANHPFFSSGWIIGATRLGTRPVRRSEPVKYALLRTDPPGSKEALVWDGSFSAFRDSSGKWSSPPNAPRRTGKDIADFFNRVEDEEALSALIDEARAALKSR